MREKPKFMDGIIHIERNVELIQVLEKSLRGFDLDAPDTDFQIGYLSALQDLWTAAVGEKWVAAINQGRD